MFNQAGGGVELLLQEALFTKETTVSVLAPKLGDLMHDTMVLIPLWQLETLVSILCLLKSFTGLEVCLALFISLPECDFICFCFSNFALLLS